MITVTDIICPDKENVVKPLMKRSQYAVPDFLRSLIITFTIAIKKESIAKKSAGMA